MIQNQNTVKNSRLNEIVFFKALCILGVLTVHSTSVAIANADTQLVAIYINRLFAFGTPLFIMISGFLYFYAYWSRPYKEIDWEKYWVKRVLYILAPYVIFTILYYVVKKFWLYPIDADWAKHLKMMWEYLKNGKSHTHLYFFLVMIQIYIAFPVFLYILKKVPRLFNYLLPLGLIVHIGFLLLNNKVGFVYGKGGMLISYISFYLLGAWLGGNYPKFKKYIRSPFRSLGSSLLFFFSFASALFFGYQFATAWKGVYTKTFEVSNVQLEIYYIVFIIPAAFLLLYLANVLSSIKDGIFKKGIRMIGIYSFGVFLIHPLFLLFYRLYVPHGDTLSYYILWLVGSYLVALVGAIVTVKLIIRYVPFYRFIVGNT